MCFSGWGAGGSPSLSVFTPWGVFQRVGCWWFSPSECIHPVGCVSAGGALVVGQEQDSRAGSFSNAESFIGAITQLHVWHRALSAQQLAAIVQSCDEYVGDVIAWPDFLAGVTGHIVNRATVFCHGEATPADIMWLRCDWWVWKVQIQS